MIGLGDLFLEMVPRFKSHSWNKLVMSFRWDPRIVDFMESVSKKRCLKRIESYVIPGELDRSRGAIRFGHQKSGHGYHKQRGDFCLIGGSFRKGHLTVFYRTVELIGGLHFDLAIYREVERHLGKIKDVTIMADRACVFGLKENSGEKLYYQLRKFYEA